jgi:hypothetical protein
MFPFNGDNFTLRSNAHSLKNGHTPANKAFLLMRDPL